jgi:hypothetical protein
MLLRAIVFALGTFAIFSTGPAAEIRVNNQPAQLDVRSAGEHSIRVTLKPVSFKPEFPSTPALAEREYAPPTITLREITGAVKARIGGLNVEVLPNPLTIVTTNADGKPIQNVIFQEDGNLSFKIGGAPVLGMGEGGPLPRGNFRTLPIEFDRRGRFEDMRPRWQSDAYGSRNPVALMIGTEGWGLFIATPWGQVDLRDANRGVFSPWQPPVQAASRDSKGWQNLTAQIQGRPLLAAIYHSTPPPVVSGPLPSATLRNRFLIRWCRLARRFAAQHRKVIACHRGWTSGWSSSGSPASCWLCSALFAYRVFCSARSR